MIHGHLPLNRILELFVVDMDQGRLYWKNVSKFHSRLNSLEAGCKRAGGSGKYYWIVKVDKKPYRRSAIIFTVHTGAPPTDQVDHKDGDSLNDRPLNLRNATQMQNAWNHKKRKKKSPYPMGVRKLGNKFHARIACNNVQHHIGCFDSQDEASAAYLQKRKELFHEFA